MEKKKKLKVLKKSLNLISIQKDVLEEKEMENLYAGRHCGQSCGEPDAYNPDGLDYADNTNTEHDQGNYKP